MSKAIEILGNHIYELTKKNPKKALNELYFIYMAAGYKCKYFPRKNILNAREYMQWAAAESAIKPLKKPEKSAIVSIYLPCEILHAMGVGQIFPEALAGYLAAAGSEKIFIETAENIGMPKTLCSYHKSFIGLAETGVLPKPKFIINTSLVCDVNHLSFRWAADYYKVPHFMIDVPSEYNERNLKYVENQLHQMVDFIEENSDFRLDDKLLEEAINRGKKTIENFKIIKDLRADRFLGDEMTSHMLSLFATHVMLGTKDAYKYSIDMIHQLQAVPKGHKGVRLLWVHTLPYWNEAIKEVLNFNERCEIVACDMVFDFMDTNLEEKDPYKYMAERLLKNTANGSANNRINAAVKYAKEIKADGVVWFCHWGCKQTAGSSALAKSVLEKNGLPTLVLEGDGCDSQNINEGQTITRLEAFIELLENRK